MVLAELIFMHSPSLMREKERLLKNKGSMIDRMDKHKKKENTGTISGFFYTGHATILFD